MKVELSLDDLIELFKMASIGKLINGFVHNLNGPLQNICMDLEVMQHSFRNSDQLQDPPGEKIITRIKRVEEEFDRIDRLVKIFAAKANPEDDYDRFMDVNEFIKQELQFFDANLYFKHDVHKELEFQDKLPPISNLPDNFRLAFSLFMEGIIEELEKREIGKLTLRTSFYSPDLEIGFTTEEGSLSEKFMELLQLDISSTRIKINADRAGMIVALAVLKTGGTSVKGYVEPSGSNVTLTIPTHNPLS